MKKTNKIATACLALFFVIVIGNSSLPCFVSYSFWEEWGVDYSKGGYELGIMSFRDALLFTPNKLITAADFVLLAIYSLVLAVILLKLLRIIKTVLRV